jgi:hypothetical protein
MKGEEIAYRTLELETLKDPCILAAWCMKREFFQKMAKKENIYENVVKTAIEAFVKAGANLCPQFIVPSSNNEHLAISPLKEPKVAMSNRCVPKFNCKTPEDIKNFVETLPDPDKLKQDFDVSSNAKEYAEYLLNLQNISKGEILFIGGFGQADFMGGYNWGYDNYLSAMALYPEHIERYWRYTAEQARLDNIAIAYAVEKHKIAPFVFAGQDICFNDGPICSPEILDKLYFPNLAYAVEPFHNANIKIIWHCDGDVRKIIPQLINKIGVSGFQGFQEETGCTLEYMSKLKTRFGKKPILWGSVSVTTTLPFGTVEDVKKDVERCFRTAAPGGGFGLASTSSILPETPYENIITMFEHGLKFGKEFLS